MVTNTRGLFLLAAVAGLALVQTGAKAATEVVNGFAPTDTTVGVWGVSDPRTGTTGSTASVVSNGPAGNPVGPGAGLITTDSTDPSMAEVGITNNYGTAGRVIPAINLAYSFYKEATAGNAASAPSIKLSFYSPTFAGDGFVTLVYEPYWNTGGTVTTDLWQTATIDANNGLFWQNGGFGQANSAGGPPLNTLAGWLSAFNSTSGGAFSDAVLTEVRIGMGSYQPSQIGYFDDVVINGTAVANTTYNFEAAPVATPLPSAAGMGLLMLGAVGAAGLLRKQLRPATL